jgi:superfamily II DNA or RNA helicase
MLLERGVRITREEIPDFPECDCLAQSYNVGKDAELSLKNIYEDMKRELALYEKKKGNSDSDSALVIQLRARQKAELVKVPLFIELAEEALENGQSVVLFLNFRDSIKAIAERLNTKCIIWGDNKGTERQDVIDKFQADKSRIVIVSVSAGAAGLSLHDLNGNYPRIALISPSFSAVDITQVLGRIHRVGGKTKAMQRIIYCANTVEEDICNSLQLKLNNLSILNDGDLMPFTKNIFKEKK